MVTQEEIEEKVYQKRIKRNAEKMILGDILILLNEQMQDAKENQKGYYWSVIKMLENLIEAK